MPCEPGLPTLEGVAGRPYAWSMSFTALHRLLGVGPRPLTDELIDEAVATGAAETDDVDWKVGLPQAKGLGQTDSPRMSRRWPSKIMRECSPVQSIPTRTSYSSSTPLYRYTPVETTVNAVQPDSDFHRQVHDLAQDCVNQGGISDVRLIRPAERDDSAI